MNIVGFAATIGILAATIYLAVVGRPILLPLVIAVFVWYLLGALAKALGQIKISGRSAPQGVCLAAAILIMLAAIWLLIELIASNVEAVRAAAPAYQRNLEDLIRRFGTSVGVEAFPSFAEMTEQISVGSLISLVAGALAGMAGNVGTVLLYVIFLLIEQRGIDQKISAFIDNPARERTVRAALQDIGLQVRTYVWLKTLTSVLTGLLSYSVLALVGVDFAVFWSIMLTVLNFIPYVGSVVGVALPSLLALLQFGTIEALLAVLGGLTVVQLIVGNAIEPRALGKSLNLSPLVILLSLAVWGSIWGVTGMVLCVPLMVILMIVLAHIPRARRIAILLSQEGRIDWGQRP
jgi:predicted PurR-regulated permease PerM